MYQISIVALLLGILGPGVAFSHGDSHGKKAARKPAATKFEETEFGRPGDAEKAVRTVKAGEFHYACLIPGHLEAGMIHRISVARQK